MRRLVPLLAAAFLTLPLAACGEEATESGGDGGGQPAESAGAYPSKTLRIMAPADPGGGWDQTSRALQAAFEQGGVTEQSVEVFNVPGAGGTIGLAQLASDAEGDDHELMVMGLVMLGAIRTNDSPVGLDEVTPIARLLTEWEAVAVKADSKYETFEQLVEDFKKSPKSVSWAGGSEGGTDHILVGEIAKEAGVNPSEINYVAHSGGGEALAAILSGGVTVGVSGVGEFADQVEAGKMRFLAVSSPEPLEGIDAPTIKDAGLDIELPNWRGIVAPPGISDEQRDQIIATLEKVHETKQWQDALAENGWDDYFATGAEFESFLGDEQSRVEGVLKEIGLIE